MEKSPTQKKKQNIRSDTQHHKIKWATFTYCGIEVRRITTLFKDTLIKYFRTQNTLQNTLKHRTHIDKYRTVEFIKLNTYTAQ
jgi:hypothetical protein